MSELKKQTETYLSQYLNRVFLELEDLNIQYCILRNYEKLPYYTDNDIDILVSKYRKQDMIRIAKNTAKELGWSLYDQIEYSCTALYFTKIIENKLEVIHLDICTDIDWKNNIIISGQEILSNIDKIRGFYIPNKYMEVIILLFIRLIYNGKVKEEYKSKIIKLIEQINFEKLQKYIISILGNSDGIELCNLLNEFDFNSIDKNVDKYRKSIKIRNFKFNSNYIELTFKYYKRILFRTICPKGRIISIMGVDGSGKSTIIDEINKDFMKIYSKKIKVFHWRPTLFGGRKNSEGQISTPHSKDEYSRFFSLLKYVYIWLDYVFGYVIKVLPYKVKGYLIIFDRYYYDLYIDKKRYRLNIPEWIIKIGEIFVAKPKYVIALTGDAEKVYNRKKEITLDETIRQINVIKTISLKRDNFYEVDCVQNIEKEKVEILRVLMK